MPLATQSITFWRQTIGAGGNVVPLLSNPFDMNTGTTTADIGVSTNDNTGTLYWVVTTSTTPPSQAQVLAGQNQLGAAAAASGNQPIVGSGSQHVSVTGLTDATQYYSYFVQQDGDLNLSAVTAANGFITGAVLQGQYPLGAWMWLIVADA